MNTHNSGSLLSVVLNVASFLGGGVFLAGLYLGWNVFALQTTTGIVADIDKDAPELANHPSRSRLSRPFATYHVDNQEFTTGRYAFGKHTNNHIMTASKEIGQTVAIYYPPDDPGAGFVVVEEWERWFTSTILLGVGVLIFIVTRILALPEKLQNRQS